MAQTQLGQNSVANFVQKAFQIISNQEHKDIIEWQTNGKQFTIKDVQKFEEAILPVYFRHRNIHSFIRQLNMYGFHKSRKQPTKNIFSHPFFQKNKKELLCQVKRKMKLEETETPQKIKNPETTEVKIPQEVKETAEKEPPAPSYCSIIIKSINNLEKEQSSPMKSFLVSKSFILDANPEVCLRHREQNSFVAQEQEQDDNLSIVDEINRERQRFNNRTQGISIVKTSNFLEEFQF